LTTSGIVNLGVTGLRVRGEILTLPKYPRFSATRNDTVSALSKPSIATHMVAILFPSRLSRSGPFRVFDAWVPSADPASLVSAPPPPPHPAASKATRASAASQWFFIPAIPF